MKAKKSSAPAGRTSAGERDLFVRQAEHVLAVPIAHRVNRLGGYGANLEVIYEAHPLGCASVLVDSRANANAAFLSNGSVAFNVKLAEGMDVSVLAASFDMSEKRETGVPSQNVWLDVRAGNAKTGAGDGPARYAASLINPNYNINCPPTSIRVVKLGDPGRAMWYCARFDQGHEKAHGRQSVGLLKYETAVKLSFVHTANGPAVLREVFVRNIGKVPLAAALWTYFNLHGTQRFVYNKDLWYDVGLPISDTETVVSATVPYSTILQIKRISTQLRNVRAVDATCDYSTFIGDTAAPAVLPNAVVCGAMLPGGAGRKLNRFSTPTIAASQFALSLKPGEFATLQQSLLYVTDAALIERFRETSACRSPSYKDVSAAFRAAAKQLVAATPGVKECLGIQLSPSPSGEGRGEGIPGPGTGGQPRLTAHVPFFEVALPAQPAISAYANSVWTGVRELYENCRAHGAKLANGIELGTRDRAQDMWPWLKENPAQVRADLVHAMSMMYQTGEEVGEAGATPCPREAGQGVPAVSSTPCPRPAGQGVAPSKMSLRQKLHGMFPRQYPSRWDDRRQEIFNDNRPYNDSATWFVNSANVYVRETGDVSILGERVKSVRLTRPDTPETSGLVGCDNTFTVAEVMVEVLEALRRHAADSPYGIVQVLYGDWCDPVDMYGTGVVGDATTRGHGRGVQVRLSAHVFVTLVETIDLFAAPNVAKSLDSKLIERVESLKSFADTLRRNIVNVAWESGKDAGFVGWIHELNADGSTPDYAAGQIGYTLGSMRGRDFDGIRRRDLTSQAYCTAMLMTERDYLTPPPGRDAMVAALLETVNTLFYSPKLGLLLFSSPVANNKLARDLVGRMGVVPAGTAENGEYHHGQVMMHRFRLNVPGEADTVWRQFKPIMSVSRDESVGGPFETPCTSYASDKDDPHFGKGMYFGLSGQIDWIVEIYHKLAGLELNLHDDRRPAITVNPMLPAELKDAMTFRRVIHYATGPGQYRQIPLIIAIRREGAGKRLVEQKISLNGKPLPKAEVSHAELGEMRTLEFEIVRVYGK